MISEEGKQEYFEEGYIQCYQEVINEINKWGHPDTAFLVEWLNKIFEPEVKP